MLPLCCLSTPRRLLFDFTVWLFHVVRYAVLHHAEGGVPVMTGAGGAAPAPTGVGGAPHLPLGAVPAAPPPVVAAAPPLSGALTGRFTGM